MDDLINRQAAIDEAEEWIETYNSGRGGQRERDAIKHVISGIKKLPSAQPDALETNIGDMISRQAAINSIMEEPSEVRYPAFYAEKIKQLPSAQSGRKAPVSYKEQLSLDCSFCRQHERGDTLYESSDWDGGIGFDYIRNIRFCPICGRELYGEE